MTRKSMGADRTGPATSVERPKVDGYCRAASIVVSALLAACCIFFAVMANRGFDVSDDAYYILSAADAGSYRNSLTEFGIFLHPFLVLAHHSLFGFRLLGALFLLGCAALFAVSVCRQALPDGCDRASRICIIAAILASAFWQYGLWLPTPNYNLLNLCGLLFFFSGLLLGTPPDVAAAPDSRKDDLAVAAISGFGLFLTMVSKPTTSLAAVFAGLVWIAVAQPARPWRAMALTAVVAMACFGAMVFLFDGSIAGFLARKSFGLHAIAILGRGHDLAGFEQSLLGSNGNQTLPKAIAAGAGALALFLLFGLWLCAVAKGRSWHIAFLLLSAVLVAWARARDMMATNHIAVLHLWHLAPAIAAFTFLLLALRMSRVFQVSSRRLACAAILAIVPIAYSIGTNNTLALHVSGAAVFWAAAALLVAEAVTATLRARIVVAVALLFSVMTLGMIVGMSITPLPDSSSLWVQSRPLVLRNHMTVLVDEAARQYFSAFQLAAHDAGFIEGTPVIDLTGQGPGMVLALGGTAPGVAWLHYGGASVMAFSQFMLEQVPITRLQSAWVVTQSGPTSAVQGRVLGDLGVDFPRKFHAVITQRSAAFGTQTLWKPVDR